MVAQIEEIKRFWDGRATQYQESGLATLGEMHLRGLEIRTMLSELVRRAPVRVLDAGCGNGYSTKYLAGRLPSTTFVGFDYSEPMVEIARRHCPPNCTFTTGDVLVEESLPPGPFECVLTQRCIQNLPTPEYQKLAVDTLMRKLVPGGTLLLMECSRDGVEQLNRVRRMFGRGPLADAEPWHNLFLRDELLIRGYDAAVVCFSSTYMFLTRVIHPRLSAAAARLPAVGRFGYDRLYVITKPVTHTSA